MPLLRYISFGIAAATASWLVSHIQSISPCKTAITVGFSAPLIWVVVGFIVAKGLGLDKPSKT